MTRWWRSRALWLVAAAAVCSPGQASAQTWGDLRLPGGLQAARRVIDVGTAGGRSDGLWLVDAIRRIQGQTEAEALVEGLRDYLDYVGTLAPLVKACPEQCRLVPRTAPSSERDRIRRFTDVLGLDRKDNDQRVELETSDSARRKHRWLAALGIDVNALAEALNAKAPVNIPLTEAVLPLPLPDYFRREVLKPGTPDVVAIVGDRASAWLYNALMSCDETTLATLAAKPELLRRLHQNRSALMVVAGRTLRLRPDRVETPGDAGAIPVWEELVGRRVTDVDRFTVDLLGNDSGRLAYFYSIVADLDERRRAFVLGQHLPAKARVKFVERIYRKFVALDPSWKIEESPFVRPDFDPQVVFALVDVTPEGTIGPSWWPSLFDRARGSAIWSEAPDRTIRALKQEAADALWLISWVFDVPEESAGRFRMLRFAQRQFASQPRNAAPAMAVALGSLGEVPVLPLALERMGIRDPALYQMLAVAARAFEGDGERDLAELQRWQVALALVEQIQRRTRSADPARHKALVSLGSVALVPRNQRPGSVGAWIAEVFLPAFVPGETGAGDPDESQIRAFLGSAAAAPQVSWEGLEYAFDPMAVQVRTAVAIQNAKRVPRLSDVAALHRIRRELEQGVKTVDAVTAIVGRLKALTGAVDALPVVDGEPARAVKEFAEILKNLDRLTTRPKDVGRASREVAALRGVIDDVTDAAVMSVTYALATVPTGELPEMLAGRWVRHMMTPADPTAPKTSRLWLLAKSEPAPAGGTVIRGSWLGVDLAMAESRLRRVGVPTGAGLGVMSDTEREAILFRLGIDNPGPQDPAAFEAVVKAVAAGRSQLAAWATRPADDRELEKALAVAGVPPSVANAARWLSSRKDAGAFAAIGPTALYRLGSGKPLPDGWGSMFVQADGCWCAIPSPPGGAFALSGRRGAGLAAALDTDLAVRLAELLASVRLPAATWSAVLPFALQEWLDNVRQFAPEDTESVMVWPRQLDAARLEQYLLMLIADGVFAPPKTGVPQ